MAAELNFFYQWRGGTNIGYEFGGHLGNVCYIQFVSLGEIV